MVMGRGVLPLPGGSAQPMSELARRKPESRAVPHLPQRNPILRSNLLRASFDSKLKAYEKSGFGDTADNVLEQAHLQDRLV